MSKTVGEGLETWNELLFHESLSLTHTHTKETRLMLKKDHLVRGPYDHRVGPFNELAGIT